MSSFATSYIPTVASTVTRAADQASMTGTNFSSWYNQSQGSFCIDYLFGKLPYAGYLYDVILGVGSTSPAQSNEIIIGNANGNVYYELGFNIIAIGVNGPASSLTKNITALSYGNSTFIGVTNGSINTSPLVINGTNFNILKLGCNTTSGQPLSAGHIRKLSYYPVALSSSNLVALTS